MNSKIYKKLWKIVDKCSLTDSFPVAAIIYKDDKIISCGYNSRNKSNRTTDHAEINAILKANKKLKTWRLDGLTMIVTLEPCDMCKTVIKESRLDKVYYLVPRLKYKKQNKCTVIEQSTISDEFVDKYREKISKFFIDKR